MAGIQVAESLSSKSKGRKALSHLEIHPKLGGGHVIRHVYSGFEHKPKEYTFGKEQGHKAGQHVSRHTGIPMAGGQPEAEGAASKEPEEE